MSASVSVTYDTSPPALPTLVLAGGLSTTAVDVVTAQINSPSADTTEMLLWGDLDPDEDDRFQPDEDDSIWAVYDDEPFLLRLVAGNGRKTIYARLRDDVHNVTPALSDWVDLDGDTPHVTIVTPPSRGRVSLVNGYDSTTFTWSASADHDRHEIKAVPTAASPREAGVLLAAHDVSYLANDEIETTVEASLLHTLAPGEGVKYLKVFVRCDGEWSA